jgi:hypothetical protein
LRETATLFSVRRATSDERRATSDERRATSDERRGTIIHASDLTALFSQYDYNSRSCLIVDVTHAAELLARSPARAPVQTLLGLVAGFDCTVLLVGPNDRALVQPVWESPTARRCTAVDPRALAPDTLYVTVQHVQYQTMHLAPPQLALPPDVLEALERVPHQERLLLWQALRSPDEWSVDRLAAAYGQTRRSRERKHEHWGLPSPSALLALARLFHPTSGA